MNERHKNYWTLIHRFHVLNHCPNLVKDEGPSSWLTAMWKWLEEPGDFDMDAGSQCAIVFLLNVYAPGNPGRTGIPWPPFDVFHALAAWDDSHKAAFAMWCMNPVRP